jgi:hypothetical protein
LNALYPRRDLQVSIYPTFTNDAQRGSVLTISSQLAQSDFRFDPSADKQATDIDLTYVVLNNAGKPVSSSEKKLTWNPVQGVTPDERIVTTFSMQIPPGLYQIRLAARDNLSGRIGGSYQWIEIPEFAPQHLALSSLLLSERRVADPQANGLAAAEDDNLNVTRSFARTSSMLVQAFVYNAAQPSGAGSPQVTMQINMFSAHRLVANSPANPLVINNGSDLTRIPCAVQLPLKSMPPGLYTLQVTAADRVTNKSITQSINFTIE